MYFLSTSVPASRLPARRLPIPAWLVLRLVAALLILVGSLSAAPVITTLNQSVNDIAYDAGTQKIYATISGDPYSDTFGTVLPLDPATGLAGTPIAVLVAPYKLAISDDGQFLYVSSTTQPAVDRVTLATQTDDFQINLGSGTGTGLQVLPGHPHSLAVLGAINGGSLAIYDDNVQRPNYVNSASPSPILFGASPDILYEAPYYFSYSPTIDRYLVNANGLAYLDSISLEGSATSFGFDNGSIFTSAGDVVDLVNKYVSARLPEQGLVCADPARNRIYYLNQYFNQTIIYAVNATTQQLVATTYIPNVSDSASSFIRCGGHRLAFAGSFDVTIVDDPTLVPSTLAVTLPTDTTENAGTLSQAGTVTLSEAAPVDTAVYLTSGNSSKLTIPASVVIPAGQLSTTFDITLVDNTLLDGPQSVAVSAAASGYDTVSSNTLIHDDETASFSVALPSTGTQGTTAQGTVTISVAPANDIVVSLASNSPFVIVPPTVTIPAGQTSATFTVQYSESGEHSGPQNATVTAHVDNWTDGSATSSVLDVPNTDWLTFGNNAGHSGYQAITTGNRQYVPGWSVSYNWANGFQPVVVQNDTVYLVPKDSSSAGISLIALDAPSGAELWQYQSPTNFNFGPPTVDRGAVYLESAYPRSPGLYTGYLSSFDGATGAINWMNSFTSQESSYSVPPVALDGGVWIDGGFDSSLYGFRSADGLSTITVPFASNEGDWIPVYDNGVVYLWQNYTLEARDPSNGIQLWSIKPPSDEEFTSRTPSIAQGRAFLVATPYLYAINLTTHAVACR